METPKQEGGSGTASPRGIAQAARTEAARVVLPEGTTFAVALEQTLSSKTSSPGDPVRARVVGAIRREGKLVVADGAEAHGVVTEVEGAGRVKGRASLAFKIHSIETVGGPRGIQTAMVAGELRAPGTKKRDAVTIAGSTAAGAALGEIIGDKPGLGAVIGGAAGTGAVIGGAAGTGAVLATKGKELTLERGTQIDFKLMSPLEVRVTRTLAD